MKTQKIFHKEEIPMKTKKTFILSLAVSSILTLFSYNVFPAGPTGAVRQDRSGTPGTVANPNASGSAVNPTATGTSAIPNMEMASPAFQKCGKNYVETKLENFPLEGPNPEGEGGAWWACKLKPGFNYSNYDPNASACPAVPGEESELRTEALQPVSANYYGCSYVGKNNPPLVQCLSGFHAIDVQESKKGVGEQLNCPPQTGKLNQKLQQQPCTKDYEHYVYDSSFKCVRNGVTFPESNFEADGEACNPTTSWLGVSKGIWQGSWPYYQICGWKPESSAPVPPKPVGPPPSQPQIPLSQ